MIMDNMCRRRHGRRRGTSSGTCALRWRLCRWLYRRRSLQNGRMGVEYGGRRSDRSRLCSSPQPLRLRSHPRPVPHLLLPTSYRTLPSPSVDVKSCPSRRCCPWILGTCVRVASAPRICGLPTPLDSTSCWGGSRYRHRRRTPVPPRVVAGVIQLGGS